MTVERFEVVATPSEGWWCIEAPAVPGVASQGRNHQEVVFMAKDAISLILDIPVDQIEVDVRYQGTLLQAQS